VDHQGASWITVLYNIVEMELIVQIMRIQSFQIATVGITLTME